MMLDAAFGREQGSGSAIFRYGRTIDHSARLSRPEPGRSLGGTVAKLEKPIRDAVGILSQLDLQSGEKGFALVEHTKYGPGGFKEAANLRLSWFFVCVSLTHAIATHRERVASFSDALEWFLGDITSAKRLVRCIGQEPACLAEGVLSHLSISLQLIDLLPYVLEPHGHITRSNLETCNVAKQTRGKKKETGVYYTPSDVADFMVSSLASLSDGTGTWLDPACGTGVFLRSVVAQQRAAVPTVSQLQSFVFANVFGVDQSALATDLAAFVLLIECMPTTTTSEGLLPVWKRLKENLVCMDSLRLTSYENQNDLLGDPVNLACIRDVFPTVTTDGFDHVVMNPPYSKAIVDTTLQRTWHSFSGIPSGKSGDTHLAFTEMLFRLSTAGGVSAAVLPLSVGTNTSDSYNRLRTELARVSGVKEFLFFDREPQALFGEDIKTRNLVLFRHSGKRKSVVRTSRLLKWTGEQRPQIFHRNRLVTLPSEYCASFIPKLGSKGECDAYLAILDANKSAPSVKTPQAFGRIAINDALEMNSIASGRTILIGGTAYNFLNCFFSGALPSKTAHPYSDSPLNTILFRSHEQALAGFAVMSSRISFWLWHVEGDGFHVTSEFLKRLPLWEILNSDVKQKALARLGDQLWQAASKNATGAVNGGRQTYSFYAGQEHSATSEIEHILIDHFQLAPTFADSLSEFVYSTVSIDGKRRLQRNHLEN